MSEHTPGSWTIEDYGDEDGSPVLVIHKDSDTRICFMATPGERGDPEEIKSNALLIAAAPEMLAALLDFIDAVDRHCIELNSQDVDIGEGRQPFPWHEAWLHNARAAIAKATGETDGK